MKKFKFEITLNEEYLEGDEFWEGALQRDNTGILELTELIEEKIKEVLNPFWEGDIKEVVKLLEFKNL